MDYPTPGPDKYFIGVDWGVEDVDKSVTFIQMPPVPQEFLEFNEAAYKAAVRSSEGYDVEEQELRSL